jgi:hypothetical protein
MRRAGCIGMFRVHCRAIKGTDTISKCSPEYGTDRATYCGSDNIAHDGTDKDADFLAKPSAEWCAHVEAFARSQYTTNEGVPISYMMSRTALSSLLTII